MSTSVDHLQERTQDASDLLTDIVPSAITLATMLRHRKMAAWLREEFDGYTDKDKAPPYRRDLPGHIVNTMRRLPRIMPTCMILALKESF